jgi:hypothetical protein
MGPRCRTRPGGPLGRRPAANDQTVLVVDETGDEKSSTDDGRRRRQYSGALGGIGVCQVAVHLTYASKSGQALVDRALYLTGVPDELAFAAKPQLAAAMLERAHQADLPARQWRPPSTLRYHPPLSAARGFTACDGSDNRRATRQSRDVGNGYGRAS